MSNTGRLVLNQFPGVMESITLSDITQKQYSGFHANVSGTLAVSDFEGNDQVLTVVAGQPYPYPVTKFKSTGTVGISNGDIIGFVYKK